MMSNQKSTSRLPEMGESRSSARMIGEYPFSSTLIAFAVGFGVGVILGSALAEAQSPAHRSTTEKLGQQLLDALTSVLPESLSQRMHR